MTSGVARRAVRTVLAVVLAGALLWAIGLDVLHAIVLGAATVALIALRRSPAVNDDQAWPDEDDTRSDSGVRREVARLSWAMQGYESRVQRQSVVRLHEIASYRLGEQGLDLEDPRDYVACESALGVRAYQVVSEPDVRPFYPDFVVAVQAVEQLAAGATRGSAAGTGTVSAGTSSRSTGSTGSTSTGSTSTGAGGNDTGRTKGAR